MPECKLHKEGIVNLRIAFLQIVEPSRIFSVKGSRTIFFQASERSGDWLDYAPSKGHDEYRTSLAEFLTDQYGSEVSRQVIVGYTFAPYV